MRRTDGELILFWTLPAVALIWISAFFLFPGFLHPMSPTMSAEEVAGFYRDEAARIRYSMILFNWFGVGLVPVVVLLALQVRRMAHRTPILTSRTLDEMAGRKVFFKCENLQRCGAFKFRGALNAVLSLSEEEASRGVVEGCWIGLDWIESDWIGRFLQA